MSDSGNYLDGFSRWAQISRWQGAQLVHLLSVIGGNVYNAQAVELDPNGATSVIEGQDLTVLNLAEPSEMDGQLPAGTETVALDLEGRWIIFVNPPGSAMFLAKVTAALGSALYTVLEQEATGAGTFADKAQAAQITACNLAEVSLGTGSAVDVGAIVLVTTTTQATDPPTLRYVFDHPCYAKYLS